MVNRIRSAMDSAVTSSEDIFYLIQGLARYRLSDGVDDAMARILPSLQWRSCVICLLMEFEAN